MTKAERIAAQAQAVAAKRGAGDRATPVELSDLKIERPTDEQRYRFSERPVPVRTEKGQVVGRAYRRQPYFLTLAKLPADRSQPKGRRLITAEQFRAMRFYRASWENSQASEMRCALDVSVRGHLGGNRDIVPGELWEAHRVRDCERPFGGDLLETMRAIILHDMSFAAVAISRWGSRERERIIVGTGKQPPAIVKEIVPRSSAHPIRIREDFILGLPLLVRAVSRYAVAE